MKRFLGWEPVTKYAFDGDRLVSSQPETEWDEEQQSWMLALQYYRSGLCPKCGSPVEECHAPENEGRYRVPPPERCHKTTALHVASEPYRTNKDVKASDALLYRVELPA